jgi:hypothetical protein
VKYQTKAWHTVRAWCVPLYNINLILQPPKNAGILQARGHATLSSDKKWEAYYFMLNADATLQIFAAVPNESPASVRKSAFGSKQTKVVDFSAYSRGQVGLLD